MAFERLKAFSKGLLIGLSSPCDSLRPNLEPPKIDESLLQSSYRGFSADVSNIKQDFEKAIGNLFTDVSKKA